MSKRMAWKARLARELGRPDKLAVLGVGNVDKGDDAAGVRTAEKLAGLLAATPCPRLKVFAAGEAPENFTGAVRAFGPSHVLVVDAAAAGFKPGTVFQVDAAAIPDDGVSTHRTPLSMLAAYLENTAACRVVILGVEPESFVPGAPLRPSVRKAAGEIAGYLAGFARRRLRSSSASKHRCS